MIHKVSFLVLFLSVFTLANGQKNIDSLRQVLRTAGQKAFDTRDEVYYESQLLAENYSEDTVNLVLSGLPEDKVTAFIYSYVAFQYAYQEVEFIKSEKFQNKADSIINELNIKDPLLFYWTNRHKGFIETNKGNIEKSIKYFEKSNEYALRADYPHGRTRNLIHIADNYSTINKTQKVFEYAYLNIEAREDKGLKDFGWAYSYMYLGARYSDINADDLAIQTDKKAKAAFAEIGDSLYVGISTLNIGKALLKLELLDSAEHVVINSRKYFSPINNQGNLATVEELLGEIQSMRGHSEKAIEYFLRADSMYQNFWFKINNYKKLGLEYRKLNEFSKAKIYLKKSIQLQLESGNASHFVEAYYHRALINMDEEKFNEAIINANKAIELAKPFDRKKLSMNANAFLHEAYLKVGKSNKAKEAQKNVERLSKEIKADIEENSIANIKLKYEVERKYNQFALEKEQALLQQKWNTKVAWLIAVSLFIILILLGQIVRISKARNKTLAAKNMEIASFNENLESKVKERTAELKESQRELSLVYNNTQDYMGMYFIKPDGEIIIESINKPYLDHLLNSGIEYNKDTLIGISFEKYMREILKMKDESIALRLNYIQTVQSSKRPINYETSYPSLSPEKKLTYAVTLTPIIENEQEDCSRIIFVMHDMTERVHAQQALLKSEDRLATIYNASQDLIGLINHENGAFIVESLNKPAFDILKLLGISPDSDQLIGGKLKYIFKHIYGLTASEIDFRITNMKKVFTERQAFTYDSIFEPPGKGVKLYFETVFSPILDEFGNCKQVLYVARDISVSKIATNKIAASEKRLSMIFNGAKDQMSVVFITPNGQLVLENTNRAFNEAWEKGGSGIDIRSLYKMDTIPLFRQIMKLPESYLTQRINQLLNIANTKKPIYFEQSYNAPNGKKYLLDVSVSPILNDEGICNKLLFVIRDVTMKHRAKEKMISKILETEDRERSRFAKELHDGLGQNLTAASINFNFAKKEIGKLPEVFQQKFTSGIKFLTEAIQESRNIAHNLMPQSISDFGYILTIESLLQNLNGSSPVHFELYNNLKGERLAIDLELSLYRITQEGINNILKHAEATQVSIQLIKHHNSVILTIEDNGKGFDAANKTSNFGLNSMKNRVSAHSGVMDIDAAPGKGTSITLEIPVEFVNSPVT